MFRNKPRLKDKIKKDDTHYNHQTLVAINELITVVSDLVVANNVLIEKLEEREIMDKASEFIKRFRMSKQQINDGFKIAPNSYMEGKVSAMNIVAELIEKTLEAPKTKQIKELKYIMHPDKTPQYNAIKDKIIIMINKTIDKEKK